MRPKEFVINRAKNYGDLEFLIEAVENAEEWVLTKEGLAARGGAYSDKASRCTVAFSRSHDGAADERTGFRLLRELD